MSVQRANEIMRLNLVRERDRYERERDELLAAFFETYDTRQHIYQAILAGDPDAKQILESGQAGPSQSG